jgi:hypothetical protein
VTQGDAESYLKRVYDDLSQRSEKEGTFGRYAFMKVRINPIVLYL